MQLEKERFEVWLFSQPDGRKFDYCDILDCLGCSFVKETTSIHNPTFCVMQWRVVGGHEYWPTPDWWHPLTISILIRNGKDERHFTAADAKAAWLKLFPESEPQITPPISTLTVNQ